MKNITIYRSKTSSFIISSLVSISILFLAVLIVAESCTTTTSTLKSGTTPTLKSGYFRYVRYGDITKVQSLIDAGADVNEVNRFGMSALMYAAWEGHEDVIMLLIQEGAVVNTRDNWGRTALWWASSEGHPTVAKLLIEAGAEVNAKTSDISFSYQTAIGEKSVLLPSTALMAASSEGHTEIVKLLIDSGADVNYQDEEGHTALKWAYDTDIVQLLREAGAY